MDRWVRITDLWDVSFGAPERAMSDWTTAVEIAKGGAQLIGVIVGLISDAIDGDGDAQERLKRVDQVLSPTSPTEAAFSRADDLASNKPSGEGSETDQ